MPDGIAARAERSSQPAHLACTRRERGRPLNSTDNPESTDTEAPEAATEVVTQAVATTTSSDASPTFAELGVIPEIVESLTANGIERTFAIQELTLPLALAGEDVIGQARTGTGKTLGFGVPLLQRLTRPGDGTPQALVVVPTRELCLQVAKDLEGASKGLGTRVVSIYGGRPYEQQIAALQSGVELVVGTPGRLLDLSRQNLLDLAHVEVLVLDEADEMLDQGFLDDVKAIMAQTSPNRQTMLFSATMPGPIVALTRSFMRRPVRVRADNSSSRATHATTTQIVFQSHRLDRVSVLARILQTPGRGRTCRGTSTLWSLVSFDLRKRRSLRTCNCLRSKFPFSGYAVRPLWVGCCLRRRSAECTCIPLLHMHGSHLEALLHLPLSQELSPRCRCASCIFVHTRGLAGFDSTYGSADCLS